MAEPDSSGAAGRFDLRTLRDTDWEDVVRAVNRLPKMAAQKGVEMAIAWAQTELRSIIDLLFLADPKTPELAKAAHRVHVALSEGFVRVMCRPDRAGFLMRRDFLAAVERQLYSPTARAVFARSVAEKRGPYVPILGSDLG